jgi:hypothetical protein
MQRDPGMRETAGKSPLSTGTKHELIIKKVLNRLSLASNDGSLRGMRRTYLLDHRILFLFGYLFYFFTPLIVGTTGAFEGFPGIDIYQELFEQVPSGSIRVYLLVTLSWLPAFFIGHYLFVLLHPKMHALQKFRSTSVSLSAPLIGLMLVMLLVVFAYLARQSLFGGYDSYDVASRGKLSTLLMIFNFFLVYQMLTRQRQSWLIYAGTLVTIVLLLSMGGRMYVFHSFIVMLIYKTSFADRRWRIRDIMVFLLMSLIVGSIFGIWRMGGKLNPLSAAYSFFAEPSFTWFSTMTYLINNETSLFNWPANFLSSFLNLIPNTIIRIRPYLVSLESMAPGYRNPLGADSLWSTIVINFGTAGSFFFIGISGFILAFLKYLSGTRRFWAVYYIMVCGMIPFQFFRDGFYILNKQLFFNFLLFPGVILLLLQYLLMLQDEWKRRENRGVQGIGTTLIDGKSGSS